MLFPDSGVMKLYSYNVLALEVYYRGSSQIIIGIKLLLNLRYCCVLVLMVLFSAGINLVTFGHISHDDL